MKLQTPILARWSAVVAVAAVLSVPAFAQGGWQPRYDPTLDCSLLPESSPHPRDLGLAAALAAAERRDLALGSLGYTFEWAEREPDPTLLPALKRLVEEYRCSSGDAGLAMLAVESAGEPVDYFVGYAQNWRRDDRMAWEAMNALAVRGDSSVYEALAAVAAEAPSRGRFGRDLRNAFRHYRGGLELWRRFEVLPVPKQVEYAAMSAVTALRGVVVRSVSGDSLSLLENEGIGYPDRIRKRALRRMARAYPSLMEAALIAYADSARARVAEVAPPEHRALFLGAALPQTYETAFPTGTSPPDALQRPADLTGTLVASVCVENRAGEDAYEPGGLAAVFSYAFSGQRPVRIPYGNVNALSGSGLSAGSAPPEVFFPTTDPDAPGQTFRIVLRPGTTVTWTLLGGSLTVSSDSYLCSK